MTPKKTQEREILENKGDVLTEQVSSDLGFIIEDSDTENASLWMEDQRKNFFKNSTMHYKKSRVRKSDNVRFLSVPVQDKASSLGNLKEKEEDCIIEDDEEVELERKNENVKNILHKLKNISINELKEQQEFLAKHKLTIIRELSLFEVQKNKETHDVNMLYKADSDDQIDKELSITQSRQFKKLIKLCSFQLESRNSILRNTVLKNFVDKYSRKSVMKEAGKSSFSNSRKVKETEFLRKKVEELTKRNKELQEKNRVLEKNQGVVLRRLEEFGEFVEQLR